MTGIYEIAVGRKARQLREQKGMSQTDVASKMGYSQQRYFKIENALVHLRVSDLFKLADALSVTPMNLLEDVKNKKHGNNQAAMAQISDSNR